VRLLAPEWLLLSIPLLIVVGLAWRAQVGRRAQLAALGDQSLIDALINFPRSRRRAILHHALWMLTGLAVVVALARPVWGQEIETVPTGDVAVMMVFDVSRSMNAQDIAPYRLERARLFAAEVVRRLSGSEVGLMLFAGDAILQAPLTTDLNTIQLFTRNASTNAIQRQGTNLQEALTLASRYLQSPYATSRYILLLTDGEDHEGELDPALQALRDQQIRVVTVGVGTPAGSTVPAEPGSTVALRDRAGADVISQLDSELLRSIADQTSGAYWSLTDAEANLESFTQTFQSTTHIEGGTQANVVEVERFALFVLLALIPLGLDTWLVWKPSARVEPAAP
jgi:Ca-activated chloride channel family protein